MTRLGRSASFVEPASCRRLAPRHFSLWLRYRSIRVRGQFGLAVFLGFSVFLLALPSLSWPQSASTLSPGVRAFVKEDAPLLVLTHIRVGPAMVPSSIAAGVTSLRTTGSLEPYTDLELKRAKIHVTSPYLEGQGAFTLQMRQLKNAEDARRTVEYWIAEGKRTRGVRVAPAATDSDLRHRG